MRKMKKYQNLENLYWWRPLPRFRVIPRPLNLGDALSPFIVDAVLTEKLGYGGRTKPSRQMLAIGSVMNHARDHAVIWGTGYNGIKPRNAYSFETLDVRAVRGPKTRNFLESFGIDTPEIYGDPGLLISRYIFPEGAKSSAAPLYIPHFTQKQFETRGMRVSTMLGDNFERLANDIFISEIVYSSSLHGLVIAEAYGIPAILVMKAKTESLHKFEDYYAGTGRESFPIAYSLEEARTMHPPEPPEVKGIQARLLNSFPLDLWL